MPPSDLKDLIANADALLAWAEGRLEWARPETKVAVRHVRDAAYWKRPVGTIIIAEGLFSKLLSLNQVVTEHPSVAGTLVVTDNKGRKFDVFKHDDGKWYAATHEPDPNKWGKDVITGQKTQEDAFLKLDDKVTGATHVMADKPEPVNMSDADLKAEIDKGQTANFRTAKSRLRYHAVKDEAYQRGIPVPDGSGKSKPKAPNTPKKMSNADKATKLAAGRRRASAAGERARKAERAKAKARSTSKKLPPVLQTSLSGTVAGEPYNLETTDGWTFLKKPTVRTVDSRVRGKTTARKHITVTVMNDKGEERTTTVIRHGKGAFSTDKSTQVHGSLNEALRAGLESSVKSNELANEDVKVNLTAPKGWTFGKLNSGIDPSNPGGYLIAGSVHNEDDDLVFVVRRTADGKYETRGKTFTDINKALTDAMNTVIRENTDTSKPRKKAPSKPRTEAGRPATVAERKEANKHGAIPTGRITKDEPAQQRIRNSDGTTRLVDVGSDSHSKAVANLASFKPDDTRTTEENRQIAFYGDSKKGIKPKAGIVTLPSEEHKAVVTFISKLEKDTYEQAAHHVDWSDTDFWKQYSTPKTSSPAVNAAIRNVVKMGRVHIRKQRKEIEVTRPGAPMRVGNRHSEAATKAKGDFRRAMDDVQQLIGEKTRLEKLNEDRAPMPKPRDKAPSTANPSAGGARPKA